MTQNSQFLINGIMTDWNVFLTVLQSYESALHLRSWQKCLRQEFHTHGLQSAPVWTFCHLWNKFWFLWKTKLKPEDPPTISADVALHLPPSRTMESGWEGGDQALCQNLSHLRVFDQDKFWSGAVCCVLYFWRYGALLIHYPAACFWECHFLYKQKSIWTHLIVKIWVQLFFPWTQETQELRLLPESSHPPHATSLPPDNSDRLRPVLGWGMVGTMHFVEEGGGNNSTLARGLPS